MLRSTPFTVNRGQTFSLSVPALEFAPGHVFGILGPNGSGKSTLLHSLAGHVHEARSSVSWNGVSRASLGALGWARHVAFVAQDSTEHADLTVRQFVQLGRIPFNGWFRPSTRTDRYIVDHALDRCDLNGIDQVLVTDLSGGQRQRAKIARALAQEPRTLLLDEPTNHLDLAAIRDTAALLRSLASTSVALVVSLHDLDLASVFTDQAAIVRGGTVAAVGHTHEVLTQDSILQHWGVNTVRVQGSGRPRYLLHHTASQHGDTVNEASRTASGHEDPPATLRAPIEPMEVLL